MYQKPTLKEIVENISSELNFQLQKDDGGPIKEYRFSTVKVLSYVLGGSIYMLYNYLDWIYKQTFPGTAQGAYLDRWATIVGEERNDPTLTKVLLRFSGEEGAVIPLDRELKSSSGHLFKTIESKIVNLIDSRMVDHTNTRTRYVDILCEAEEFGNLGEFSLDERFTLVSPLAQVDLQAKLVSAIQGSEQEDDESLREKVRQAWIRPFRAQIGTREDYVRWVKQAPFVDKVWIIDDIPSLHGAMGIMFITKNAPFVPTPEEIKEVAKHIDACRPVTATGITIVAPEIKNITVKIAFESELLPPEETISSARKDLTAYFYEKLAPGEKIYLENLREIITKNLGSARYRLLEPVQDLQLDLGTLAFFTELRVTSIG
ncbi:MAG: baseplate J/gp47 family protein [Oligoflexia bacterium]|nr:baseplate J/gp47 family protein [Oligoflexia bacterium]